MVIRVGLYRVGVWKLVVFGMVGIGVFCLGGIGIGWENFGLGVGGGCNGGSVLNMGLGFGIWLVIGVILEGGKVLKLLGGGVKGGGINCCVIGLIMGRGVIVIGVIGGWKVIFGIGCFGLVIYIGFVGGLFVCYGLFWR